MLPVDSDHKESEMESFSDHFVANLVNFRINGRVPRDLRRQYTNVTSLQSLKLVFKSWSWTSFKIFKFFDTIFIRCFQINSQEIFVDISLKIINLKVQPLFPRANKFTFVYIPGIPHTTQRGDEITTIHEKFAQVEDVYHSRHASSVNKHAGAKVLQLPDRCATLYVSDKFLFPCSLTCLIRYGDACMHLLTG